MTRPTLEHTPRFQDDRTLGDYLEVVYRRRLTILVVILSAACFAYYFSKKLPPRYEARAVFYLPQDVVGLGEGPEHGKARVPVPAHELTESYATLLQTADALRAMAERFPEKSLAEFFRDVDIVVTRESLIRVYVRDSDPRVAADVANGFIDYFRDFHRRTIQSQLDDSIARVNRRIAEVQGEKSTAETALKQFHETNNIVSLGTETIRLEEQRLAHRESIRAADVSMVEIRRRVQGIEEQLSAEAASYESGEIILPNPVLDSLKQNLTRLEVEIAGKQTDLRPDHPDMVSLREQYARARENLQTEIDRVIRSKSKLPGTLYAQLRQELVGRYVDLAAVEARREGLIRAIENIDQRAAMIPALTADLEQLRENIDRPRDLLVRLFATRDGLETRRLQVGELAIVLEEAQPPTGPVFPIPILNVGIAVGGAIIAGIIYALFLDHMEIRKRLRRMKDLEMQEWVRSLSADSTPTARPS